MLSPRTGAVSEAFVRGDEESLNLAKKAVRFSRQRTIIPTAAANQMRVASEKKLSARG